MFTSFLQPPPTSPLDVVHLLCLFASAALLLASVPFAYGSFSPARKASLRLSDRVAFATMMLDNAVGYLFLASLPSYGLPPISGSGVVLDLLAEARPALLAMRLAYFALAFFTWVMQLYFHGIPPSANLGPLFLADLGAALTCLALVCRDSVILHLGSANLGVLSIATSTLLAAAPQLVSVFQTGRLASKPASWTYSLALFCCAALWAVYGLCLGNPVVYLPNVFNMLVIAAPLVAGEAYAARPAARSAERAKQRVSDDEGAGQQQQQHQQQLPQQHFARFTTTSQEGHND